MRVLSDMGGLREFYGPVVPEAGEPVFHAPADGRAMGIAAFALALTGRNVDAYRFATERLRREDYLSSYYERMLRASELLLEDRGLLPRGAVDARLAGHADAVPAPPGRAARLRLAVVSAVLRAGLRPRFPRVVAARVLPAVLGTRRPTRRAAAFAVGDPVRVRAVQPPAHTRQPGYVTGRPGVVTARHGAALLPDAHARRRRARPVHLYTVAFTGEDLWGPGAEPGTEVRVDLYEPYLERR